MTKLHTCKKDVLIIKTMIAKFFRLLFILNHLLSILNHISILKWKKKIVYSIMKNFNLFSMYHIFSTRYLCFSIPIYIYGNWKFWRKNSLYQSIFFIIKILYKYFGKILKIHEISRWFFHMQCTKNQQIFWFFHENFTKLFSQGYKCSQRT